MPVDVNQTLRKALATLQTERNRIDRQIVAIEHVLGGRDGRGRGRPPRVRNRGRRRISAAARRAASKRMKAYWAKRKAVVKRSRRKK
jgi:hypothetical protein